MKAKHLLFSSLFLSMGFAACTNEVEEFSTQQNPTEAAKGIELGEGFKINVAYGGAEVDADTRAALERNEANDGWKASWQTGDKIGAAMYSMITGKHTSGPDAGKVTGAIDFLKDNSIYASNNEYAYDETEDGITFTSASNAMVGAYLLYYPFNDALNKAGSFGEIPVYVGEKATSNLSFKVDEIGEQVSDRIFAATLAYFDEGGQRAPKFTVQQIPNLYMIKFELEDKLLMKLDQPLQINSIIVEANGGEGVKVINTNGIVKPKNNDPANTAFDYYKQTIEGTYYSLGDIQFVGQESTRSESLIVDVTPSADASKNAEYMINVTGKDGVTQPIFFSALPMEENVKEVTFTIVGEVNGVQKVYSKTYTTTWGDEGKTWTKFKELITGNGKTVNLKVILDSETTAGKVYTPEQFYAEYENGKTEFTFAQTMTLDTNIEKSVIFNGKPVIINGDVIAHGKTITFNNHVNVEGKVEVKTITNEDKSTTAGKVAFNGEATEDEVTCSAEITSDITVEGAGSQVTAKNKISAANVTATNGSILIKNAEVANITATGATITTGEISAAIVSATNEANVTFGKATLSGAVTANNSTVIIAEGSTLPSFTATDDANAKIAGTVSGKVIATDSEVTIAGTVSDAVEATNSEVTINGTVNSLSATNSKVGGVTNVVGKYGLIGSTTDKNSQVEAGEISVDQNSAFTAKALNAGTMTVNGIATATGVNVITTLNVEPNAEVTLTGKNVKTSKVENVNVKKNETTGKYGILNISKNLPLYNVANDGEINADAAIIANGANNAILTGSFTVIGTFDQNANADGTTVTVNGETAVLNINKTTALASLTNNAIVNIAAKSELTFDEATNNGEINVMGTLTETTKNTLIMTEDATINALKGATLTMGKGTPKEGTVYVENGTKALTYVTATYFTAVVYKWNKTVAPDANAAAAINTIIAEEGATLDGTADDETNLILKGNVTLAESLSITGSKNLTVDGDVTIKGKKAVTLTLTNGLTNKFVVTSGSSLTLGDNNVTLGGKTWNHDSDDLTPAINSQLIVEDGASFTGNDNEIKNLDIKYNM